MEKRKRKTTYALFFNILLVILELVGFSKSINEMDINIFKFYTEDSNLIALMSCSVYIIFCLKYLKTSRKIPKWVNIFKYMSVCSLAVTFIVVITILAPTMENIGYIGMLFSGSMLYHHTLCPIIAIISFVLFEENEEIIKKDTIYAILFTSVYAVITITLNIMHIMTGPYPFLHVYEQPIYMSIMWCVVILGGAYILAYAMMKLNKRVFRNIK